MQKFKHNLLKFIIKKIFKLNKNIFKFKLKKKNYKYNLNLKLIHINELVYL